jgi:hypothetical protein
MASNIFMMEARDIVNFLERHGFTARIVDSHIEVDDPVWVSNGGGRNRTEYNKVSLNGWPSAIKFVDDRS